MSRTGDRMIDVMNGRKAVVCINSWAGRSEIPCTVICETPKRYEIVLDAPNNLISDGLVPKYAIRFSCHG